MKTILAPTDYSETANNAVDYAVELARLMKARLILVHAYHVPAQVNKVPFTTITEKNIEKANIKELNKLEKKIIKKAPELSVESVVRSGFAVDVITGIAREKEVDMVVMGISGAGAVGEALIGSSAVDTIRESEVPVMVVPGKATFRKPDKVVFATDYSDVKEKKVFASMLELVKLFGSKLFVVNVIREDETATFKKAIAGVRLENILEDMPHTLHFPVNKNVIEGINDFVEDTNAGMVVMVAQKHNIFYRLFNQSSTKRMAFRTKVPLLALPYYERGGKKAKGKK